MTIKESHIVHIQPTLFVRSSVCTVKDRLSSCSQRLNVFIAITAKVVLEEVKIM